MKRSIYILTIFICMLVIASCGTSRNAAKKNNTDNNISSNKRLKNKYSEFLNVKEDDIQNIKLYSLIDEWYGVPYKYAGKSKNGIDCSGFASIVYEQVYNKQIGGPASSIYNQCKSISKDDLKEGDLVFFKIESDRISHVGVYLQNNKFVHASTKKGILINNLNEDYYKKYFYKGGRLKDEAKP